MATRHSNPGTVPADLGDLTDAAPTTSAPWRLATLRPNHPMVTFHDNLDHAVQQPGGEECKGNW
jgi:hypothetical protein